jgi:vesicle-associated membrane protein 7
MLMFPYLGQRIYFINVPATQTILSKIPPNNSKLTYVWEQYLFHYVSDGGFTYLVMADDSAGRCVLLYRQSHLILTLVSCRRMPFAFLADLKRKVSLKLDLIYGSSPSTQFSELPSSSSSGSLSSFSALPAHGLQGTFSPIIAELMHTYNTTPPTDELTRAQTELNQVKDIMVQNVEQILSRGERIELLVDKTDTMANQATAFRRGARSVRRQMWWRNSKIIALSFLVALVSSTLRVQITPHSCCPTMVQLLG